MHKDGAARAVLGCLALPAVLGWCSWCEGFPALEGRSENPQSHCLFLLKNFPCPHSSCAQLLWMEALTQRLINAC